MEIGSFIGLDLEGTGEYYDSDLGIARLNSARAGIYHACKLYNCHSVYLPNYLCPSVKKYLNDLNIDTKWYRINDNMEPIGIKQEKDHAVIIVNYFGILSQDKMQSIVNKFQNVIIDNSAAFFAEPISECYNVYSPRKFFGVPDGCYVMGHYASKGTDNYKQDYSSSTSSFLFKTIEYGTNATYSERMINEGRIDNSEPMKMSGLTKTLLKHINYEKIMKKRVENFKFAHLKFSKYNLFDPLKNFDKTCVPMVYPLVIKNRELDKHLRDKKVYVGRLWNKVLEEVPSDSFEAWMSKYMIPLPIDQRYGRYEITCLSDYVKEILKLT